MIELRHEFPVRVASGVEIVVTRGELNRDVGKLLFQATAYVRVVDSAASRPKRKCRRNSSASTTGSSSSSSKVQ